MKTLPTLKSWNSAMFAAAVVLYATTAANAASMTYNVTGDANTFQVGTGVNPPPVDPVNFDFTITFDPTLEYTGETSGISVNSLDIALGSAISFNYDPDVNGGRLEIGGINAGSNVIIFNPSTNDFWLFINEFLTTPEFDQMGYTQTAVSSNNLFFTLNQTGSVNVEEVVAPIPEPSALVMLLIGAPAAFVVRRRVLGKR